MNYPPRINKTDGNCNGVSAIGHEIQYRTDHHSKSNGNFNGLPYTNGGWNGNSSSYSSSSGSSPIPPSSHSPSPNPALADITLHDKARLLLLAEKIQTKKGTGNCSPLKISQNGAPYKLATKISATPSFRRPDMGKLGLSQKAETDTPKGQHNATSNGEGTPSTTLVMTPNSSSNFGKARSKLYASFSTKKSKLIKSDPAKTNIEHLVRRPIKSPSASAVALSTSAVKPTAITDNRVTAINGNNKLKLRHAADSNLDTKRICTGNGNYSPGSNDGISDPNSMKLTSAGTFDSEIYDYLAEEQNESPVSVDLSFHNRSKLLNAFGPASPPTPATSSSPSATLSLLHPKRSHSYQQIKNEPSPEETTTVAEKSISKSSRLRANTAQLQAPPAPQTHVHFNVNGNNSLNLNSWSQEHRNAGTYSNVNGHCQNLAHQQQPKSLSQAHAQELTSRQHQPKISSAQIISLNRKSSLSPANSSASASSSSSSGLATSFVPEESKRPKKVVDNGDDGCSASLHVNNSPNLVSVSAENQMQSSKSKTSLNTSTSRSSASSSEVTPSKSKSKGTNNSHGNAVTTPLLPPPPIPSRKTLSLCEQSDKPQPKSQPSSHNYKVTSSIEAKGSSRTKPAAACSAPFVRFNDKLTYYDDDNVDHDNVDENRTGSNSNCKDYISEVHCDNVNDSDSYEYDRQKNSYSHWADKGIQSLSTKKSLTLPKSMGTAAANKHEIMSVPAGGQDSNLVVNCSMSLHKTVTPTMITQTPSLSNSQDDRRYQDKNTKEQQISIGDADAADEEDDGFLSAEQRNLISDPSFNGVRIRPSISNNNISINKSNTCSNEFSSTTVIKMVPDSARNKLRQSSSASETQARETIPAGNTEDIGRRRPKSLDYSQRNAWMKVYSNMEVAAAAAPKQTTIKTSMNHSQSQFNVPAAELPSTPAATVVSDRKYSTSSGQSELSQLGHLRNTPNVSTSGNSSNSSQSLFQRFSKTFSLRFGNVENSNSNRKKLKSKSQQQRFIGSSPDLVSTTDMGKRNSLDSSKYRKGSRSNENGHQKLYREVKCYSGDSGIQLLEDRQRPHQAQQHMFKQSKSKSVDIDRSGSGIDIEDEVDAVSVEEDDDDGGFMLIKMRNSNGITAGASSPSQSNSHLRNSMNRLSLVEFPDDPNSISKRPPPPSSYALRQISKTSANTISYEDLLEAKLDDDGFISNEDDNDAAAAVAAAGTQGRLPSHNHNPHYHSLPLKYTRQRKAAAIAAANGAATGSGSVSQQQAAIAQANKIRGNIIQELLTTEQKYVKTLQDIIQGFLIPAKQTNNLFNEKIIQRIFANIEDLLTFHLQFARDLTNAIQQPDINIGECEDPNPNASSKSALSDATVGHVFIVWSDQFHHLYSDYCCQNSLSIVTLRQVTASQEYVEFFEICRRKQQMDKLPLHGFLLRPIQRICQYHLQLSELVKHTPKSHDDYEAVVEALDRMKQVAMNVNETQRQFDMLKELVKVQMSIEGFQGPDLLDKNTRILHSGDLVQMNQGSKHKEVHVIILNQEVLICRKNPGKGNSVSLALNTRIDLNSSVWVNIDSNEEDDYFGMVHNSWRLYNPNKCNWILFTATSPTDKRKWTSALESTTNQAQFFVSIKIREIAKLTQLFTNNATHSQFGSANLHNSHNSHNNNTSLGYGGYQYNNSTANNNNNNTLPKLKKNGNRKSLSSKIGNGNAGSELMLDKIKKNSTALGMQQHNGISTAITQSHNNSNNNPARTSKFYV